MGTIYLYSIGIFGLMNGALFIVFLFIAFKYLETFWSYKISKPYQWEQAVKNKKISKELKSLEFQARDKVRFYAFWFQIERLRKNKISGDFAELGVYKGVTANILHEMDKSRKLHLFDTFRGFDQADLNYEVTKEKKYSTKEFSDTTAEAVRRYIDGGENIQIHEGYFPKTTLGIENELFSFVNIDADLYKPTIEGLRFFYPRLAPGGVIFIHDYNHNWNGIQKAVDEFIATIPENVVALPDWQGTAMLIKNGMPSPD